MIFVIVLHFSCNNGVVSCLLLRALTPTGVPVPLEFNWINTMIDKYVDAKVQKKRPLVKGLDTTDTVTNT